MKIALRLKRHHYLARVSVFLIMVALIAGMIGSDGKVGGADESYTLAITSTSGGSVTEPGEGAFTRNAATVVNLVAEADEGYRFVSWTGDVDAIENVNAAVTTIAMEDDYSIIANFVGTEPGEVGVKAGDWVKLDYTFIGWPAGQAYPEWLKVEFLSIEGTVATVRLTQRASDRTQQSHTASIDISGIDVALLAGTVIFANRTTGDSVYIVEYGNAIIENEATRTYAGANRTVVYASFSYSGAQVTYYWDKLTGVMVEVSTIYPELTVAVKAVETNMWGTTATRMPWWPWIIVAVVVVGLVIFLVGRRRPAVRKKRPAVRRKGTA